VYRDLIDRLLGLIDRPLQPQNDQLDAQDPLSDVLRSVRLRGAVFFYVKTPAARGCFALFQPSDAPISRLPLRLSAQYRAHGARPNPTR
jgi:hypothetical protein